MKFIHRQRVRWKDDEGFVNFIDDDLITICVREWEKTPEMAEHSVQKMNQVNVVSVSYTHLTLPTIYSV